MELGQAQCLALFRSDGLRRSSPDRPPSESPAPRPAPHVPSVSSLRTELLVRLALLTAAALFLAVASVVLLYDVMDPSQGAIYISVLVAADVCVVVAYGAFLVQRLVIQPLREAVVAAEAIAAGDLRRRVPEGSSTELQQLSASVNRMTDRLLEEQSQVVRAEKLASIGRLAAGVAHEIGNPLGAIHAYVHTLRRAPDARDARELLEAIDRESGRIDRIIRGLLDYARSRPLGPTPVDVSATARSTVDLLATQGVLKGVEVVLQLPSQAAGVGPWIHADRHDLEQLFVNLLLNAADALEHRGRLVVRVERAARLTLRLPAVRRELDAGVAPVEHAPSTRAQSWLSRHDAVEVARIVIADSGPGVPPELAERIFDPFFTTKHPGKGTGLGLAIVARVVDNLGGTVWVTEAREGGAAFHVLLPLAPAAGSIRATPSMSRRAHAGGSTR